ncbi:hypothetical protein EVAR_48752_1 [Eumeta japonica]|uniref:Uncharacterized protein n=1 Tax=Eumeta variegata TaxID=151549 RepID=A0A4C1YJR7_EUMVA|nr:hypothetical protein EVAR_48752_1 [Eumeta japonica]
MSIGYDRRRPQSPNISGLQTTANQYVASGVFCTVKVGHTPRTRVAIFKSPVTSPITHRVIDYERMGWAAPPSTTPRQSLFRNSTLDCAPHPPPPRRPAAPPDAPQYNYAPDGVISPSRRNLPPAARGVSVDSAEAVRRGSPRKISSHHAEGAS